MHIDNFLASKTLEAVTDNFALKGKHVLDIGSGKGALAALTADQGAHVWAVDSELPTLHGKNVQFISGLWPDVVDDVHQAMPKVDLVIFARSLQLMAELEIALDALQRVISDETKVCVESFAFKDTNETTIQWVLSYIQQLEASGLAEHARHPFYEHLLKEIKAINKQAWIEHSTCFSHPVSVIKQALEARFGIVSETKQPFFFRHFAPMLLNADDSKTIQRCYEAESQAISQQNIQAIGRHWWCSAPVFTKEKSV